MLDSLTSGYTRKDIRNVKHSLPMETNIGRLFSTFAFGLDMIQEQSDKIRLWDDIDNAQGIVLDRHAENFGLKRNGANDEFLRLLIKVKMISLLSGGDIYTVVKAAAALFNVLPEQIILQEIFPAKIKITINREYLDEWVFNNANIIIALMKRIVIAGVGIDIEVELREELTLYLGFILHTGDFITIRQVV